MLETAGYFFHIPPDEVARLTDECASRHGMAPKALSVGGTKIIAFGKVVPTKQAPASKKRCAEISFGSAPLPKYSGMVLAVSCDAVPGLVFRPAITQSSGTVSLMRLLTSRVSPSPRPSKSAVASSLYSSG